uniref:Uncharacterized protein n=1 Tax=Anguilla anguilla TaxID=7936 RepID=A0A0E9TPJ5_ANGAN
MRGKGCGILPGHKMSMGSRAMVQFVSVYGVNILAICCGNHPHW